MWSAPRAACWILVAGLTAASRPDAALIAFELKPATLSAYDRYIRLTEERIHSERRAAAPSLWLDRQPAALRDKAMADLQRGEVVIAALRTLDAGRTIEISDGLIHHWVGTVLMPRVTVDRVVAFVQDYDRYPQVFAPMIQRARVKSHDGDRFVVAMRTYVKKVITVVLDADYEVHYERLGPTRVATTNVATNLYQVQDAGTPAERREAGDMADGFLWRFRMYCTFEERPQGSLEQCESVSLSRGLPFGLGWVIGPFVTTVPREALELTLGRVRAGLVR